MPVKNSNIKKETLAAHKQLSYENLVAAWLTGDGWEVLIPAIDHGKKTDLVIADETNFYRIQVKTVESSDDRITVENKWEDAKIDYVIYFSRTAEWGYIAPAFNEKRKRLNSPDHIRFHNHSTNFLKAFKKI
ncbi:MAG: group I intron-associated PD-(D/E)XK endonuclease [Methylicorpusculum sp.]|nr:group I intron-associated PD-(D/E)XK endonuclease [Methylicorpusculum sp.]